MAPTSPKVPAGQVESQEEAPASLKVPAAHAWQMLVSSYFPATQSEQEAAPTEETLPGAQSVQLSDPAELHVPEEQ